MRAFAALVSVSASLHITVWPDGTNGPHHAWTLHCPQRTVLCGKLARVPRPFAPVPANVACSQIYSGPQIALVTGTYRGRRVHARFNRRNGCETARWNAVRFLFR